MPRLETLCQERGVKLTKPCRTVLGVIERARDHPCAQEIHRRVQEERPISLGTIYRVLNRLAAAGILTRHAFNGSRMRFEAPSHRHHHLVDVRTGQIVEIDDGEFMLLIEQTVERLGYRLIDFKVEVTAERVTPAERP
ncbi:MAG: transcriptional repressor [Enhydrobacter sp.]|nr:transcriptional repressor [Enhydrobacter sp.]